MERNYLITTQTMKTKFLFLISRPAINNKGVLYVESCYLSDSEVDEIEVTSEKRKACRFTHEDTIKFLRHVPSQWGYKIEEIPLNHAPLKNPTNKPSAPPNAKIDFGILWTKTEENGQSNLINN